MGAGIILDIQRFSIHDGPGIRTTVFLKGCPLDCWWCHNPESQDARPQVFYQERRCLRCGACVEACLPHAIRWDGRRPVTDWKLCLCCGECVARCPAAAREIVGKQADAAAVIEQIRRDAAFYDESGGGVTFSGGEPLAQCDFLAELLDRCGAEDIHRAVDTAGYAPPDAFRRIAARTDLFLYDLKVIDPLRHEQLTGQPNEWILANLAYLDRERIPTEIRVPVIPGLNDDDETIAATAAHVAALTSIGRVTLLPQHIAAMDKYARLDRPCRCPAAPPPDADRRRAIADIFARRGLTVSVGGDRHE